VTASSRDADYVELHCHSAFSLLDGASSPEALVARAAQLGQPALALTDHDDLGGAVRFAQAAEAAGIGGIVGVELTVLPDDATDDATTPADVAHLVLLAATREGYGNVATLVTRARMDAAERGRPAVPLATVLAHARGVVALTGCPRGLVPRLVARGDDAGARMTLHALREAFGADGLAVEVWDHRLPEERALVRRLLPLARTAGVPWVVTNDVHYATRDARPVHDVLTALRHGRALDAMGTRLRPNGEWYLKRTALHRQRWRGDLAGLRATRAIAERCAFRLRELRPSLPVFALPHGVDADDYLAQLVETGAVERWGADRTPAQRAQLDHELAIIRRLGMAGYFLIVWDIVRFARREGILCQGRGSAANSAVCFCLGITAVDPVRMGLLFERFLSEERREPPDIDIDFAHRERERVLQYVYRRYGREHAAMVCEQITWRGRSAVRDAARVLGFSVEQGDALAQQADRFSARSTAAAIRAGLGIATPEEAHLAAHLEAPPSGVAMTGYVHHPRVPDAQRDHMQRDAAKRALAGVADPFAPDPLSSCGPVPVVDPHAERTHEERRNPTTALGAAAVAQGPSLLERAGLDPTDPRVQVLADVVDGLHQLPRHRSIHVGGFVLTREPLSTVTAIEPASMPGRTVICWERDDLDHAGLVKIDLLGLGMLTVVQDCLLYVRRTRGVTIDLASLDLTDQSVYDDLCRADTIGVFQVESRAQMNTLPRLKPRCFYDVVVEVALIRPGPIQGEMVHPYLRRRAGEEPVVYPHPSLEPILERTLGVPLFQEQGMQVAIACAGFTPGEADELRRAMGHKRSAEKMEALRARMLAGMARNGIAADVADRIFAQLNAFADYGFPESHAASFALIVYASAWLRHYYAPEFAAAILNAQPMGFYSPGTLVEDARRHGVEVRPVDLTKSAWDATLEPRPRQAAPALRLGVRSIRGLGAAARGKLEAALAQGPFTSVADAVDRTRLDRRALRLLAEAGAFDAMFPHEAESTRRRRALWEVLAAVRGDAGPLAPAVRGRDVALPGMSPAALTDADYRVTGISLLGHPMAHLRAVLAPNGIRTARQLLDAGRDGEPVGVAGLVICRQRPGTAKGFVFLSLEDETGIVNVVVTPQRFARDAEVIGRSPMLLVRGVLQVEGRVVTVRARRFLRLDSAIAMEDVRSHDYR
jgi:error-prone DNA polymerase